MLIRKLNNESGIVLVVVIAFILIMSVLLTGIFGRNASLGIVSIDQIRSIKAEALARGAYWIAYDQLRTDDSLPPDFTEVLDGITYTIVFSRSAGNNEIYVDVTCP